MISFALASFVAYQPVQPQPKVQPQPQTQPSPQPQTQPSPQPQTQPSLQPQNSDQSWDQKMMDRLRQRRGK